MGVARRERAEGERCLIKDGERNVKRAGRTLATSSTAFQVVGSGLVFRRGRRIPIRSFSTVSVSHPPPEYSYLHPHRSPKYRSSCISGLREYSFSFSQKSHGGEKKNYNFTCRSTMQYMPGPVARCLSLFRSSSLCRAVPRSPYSLQPVPI